MSHDDNFIGENKFKLPTHIAYSVEKDRDDKDQFQIIGAAWPAKNGGLSLRFNVKRFKGDIVLRSREALERMRSDQENKLVQTLKTSQ